MPPRTGISDSGYPPSRADLKARIIEIRGEAKARDTRQRMEGEIIRHEENGQSRIRTDKGEVTVRFQTKTPPPEGTRVQIELPPEKAGPQAQATIQVTGETKVQPAATRAPSSAAASPPPAPEQQFSQPVRPPPLPLAPDTAKTASEPVTPYNPARPAAEAPLQAEFLVRITPYSGTVLPAPAATSQDVLKSAMAQFSMQTVSGAELHHNAPTFSAQQAQTQGFPTEQKPLAPPSPLAPLSPDTVIPFRTAASLPAFNAGPEIISATQGNVLPPTVITTAETGHATSEPPALMDIRIKNISTPVTQTGKESAIEKILTNAKASENIAVVSGRTPKGLPVLSLLTGSGGGGLPGGLFVLQFNAANLPGGTIITFAPENIITATAPAAPSAAPATMSVATPPAPPPAMPYALPVSLPAQHWPVFEELLQTLQQASPQLTQAVSTTIPSPANPGAMAPAILFFVAALRSGDIQSWLGDKTLDILRKSGKGDLTGRLARDVSSLSRPATEPAAQDWRMLSLPLYWQGDVQKLQLFYRHDRPPRKDDEDAAQKQGTRFIFDLDLNRMGTVQLDGLHRPVAENSQNGRLDLILRTIRPISMLMQQKMRQTYYNALTQAGVHGELQFQGKAERFVKIDAATPHHESVI